MHLFEHLRSNTQADKFCEHIGLTSSSSGYENDTAGFSAFGQVDFVSCMDSDSLDKDACAAWLVEAIPIRSCSPESASCFAYDTAAPGLYFTFSSVPIKDVEYVLSITEKACPSVGDCVLPHATPPLVLAPPVSHCTEYESD